MLVLASKCQLITRLTNSTPELRVAAASNHRAFSIGPEDLLDGMECPDDLLAVPRVQAVLWGLLHGEDEDIAASL